MSDPQTDNGRRIIAPAAGEIGGFRNPCRSVYGPDRRPPEIGGRVDAAPVSSAMTKLARQGRRPDGWCHADARCSLTPHRSWGRDAVPEAARSRFETIAVC